ncbi:TIGR04255 family protein [Singulisphaera acidiphila]|uniref:TIGR04255 family protein n=1 Tax=Singulisphaera acidiphila (strain ATCC BAA-1392 / DSM 18658 / VKM B-2454 / MOB10) TaxID=886293 RepID=L0DGB2_SINAD|nr:TIGR04255 family protein [Singulisphaera acidiphila]AGA28399.1 hypothetical protein Sinac_4195 [Singulisphaera acidiphila DSM 18658]
MTANTEPLLRFTNSPLDEFFMGVQFNAIPNFSNGHFGWFWKNYLDHDWTKALDASYLPDAFEHFGQERQWAIPGVSLQAHGGADRLQVISADDERVIQIQNTRFLYNWRKRKLEYPSFVTTYPDFRDKWELFQTFLKDANLGQTTPNQWEICYINSISKGTLWNSPADWSSILPGLLPQDRLAGLVEFENLASEYRYEIPSKRGRIRIAIQHARSVEHDGPEFLKLQLMARGPIVAGMPEWNLDSGLNLGHRVLVETFERISSPEAKSFWGRQEIQ